MFNQDGMYGQMAFWFPILTGIFIILFVLAAVFIVVSIVRNSAAARRQGFDPVTMQTDIVGQFGQNLRASAPKTSQERLDELEALRTSQKITSTEYDDARARILREL